MSGAGSQRPSGDGDAPMNAARWAVIESLCDDALALPPAERTAFLARACAGDASLRREVESLLAQLDSDPSFLERPIIELAGRDRTVDVELPAGERIGPYRLVRTLGRGGMGHVYQAVRDTDDIRRVVALKVIRRGMDTDEVLQRFRLERRILAGLNHPNIATLLDAGATADGRPFFVMEYVDGEPLTDYCDGRRLSVNDRLELFRIICSAVQHAHQHLVIHRDLKPGNILVTSGGVPKLLDFGIGKVLDASEAFGSAIETRADVRLLTPEYAAPEQITGETITTATDVYALGVLLYVLLTGHHPYHSGSGTARDTEQRVLRAPPTRPSDVVGRAVPGRSDAAGAATPADVSALRATSPAQLRRRLSGDLDNIVLMALRREPARRYPSTSALAEDIRRHLHGLPVAARPDTFRYRARKFIGRNRAGVATAAVVFIALAAISTVTVAQSRRVARESERVANERDKALDVRGFLLEMFGASRADQSVGETVTVRQLLDLQAAQLARTYVDQPDRRAEMMEVLADGYDRLGLVTDAEPLAREALALRRALGQPRSPELASSLTLHGWILHELGRSTEAEPMLREAIDIRRAAGVRFREPLARSLNDLGVVYNALSRHEEALTVLTEALEIRRAVLGDEHRAVGISASNLAAALYFLGRVAEAMEVQALALRALEASVGPDHQRTVVALSNLASFKVALGELDAAEHDYRELLERQSRIQGRDHPVAARVIGSLASVVHDRALATGATALLVDAEALYREAIAALEARLGASHPQTAQNRTRLAGVLLDRGEALAALQQVQRAIADLESATEPNRGALVAAGNRLALVHLRLGNHVDAERVQRQTVAGSREVFGASHAETGYAELILCEVLLARGDDAAAAPHCGAAAAALREAPSGQSRRLARAHLRLARVHLAAGDTARADSSLAAAAALRDGAAMGAVERLMRDSLLLARRPAR